MPFALLALAALPLSAAPLPRAKPCERPAAEKVEARGPMRATRLGEQPPGKQLLAVYRSVDGCPTPMVVREEVGQPRR